MSRLSPTPETWERVTGAVHRDAVTLKITKLIRQFYSDLHGYVRPSTCVVPSIRVEMPGDCPNPRHVTITGHSFPLALGREKEFLRHCELLIPRLHHRVSSKSTHFSRNAHLLSLCAAKITRRRFPANNSDNDVVGASPLAMEISIRGVIGYESTDEILGTHKDGS